MKPNGVSNIPKGNVMKTETNLIEALLEELDRNRVLLEIYRDIGNAGVFAGRMIELEMERTKKAMAERDTAKMIRCLKALQRNKC